MIAAGYYLSRFPRSTIRRDHHDELNVLAFFRNYRSRIKHRRQDAHQFFVATARQQRDDRPRWIEFVSATEFFTIITWAHFARQRVADVLDLSHAARRKPLLLERQNREQQIDIALHAMNAIRAPGPQLRTDVVNDRHSAPSQPARPPQIKVGPVNQNYGVRLSVCGRAFQLAKSTPEFW